MKNMNMGNQNVINNNMNRQEMLPGGGFHGPPVLPVIQGFMISL